MADLEPLIRYRKHGVDEKRRALALLYEQADKLAQNKKSIEDEVDREKKLAEETAREETSAEMAAYLGRYLEGARKKIEKINSDIRKLETRIAVAQEDVRRAFAEMKKVEITQRNRRDREKAETKKKEENELDEIAIENYRRHKEGGD